RDGCADATDLQRGLRNACLEGADVEHDHQNTIQSRIHRSLCLWAVELHREFAFKEKWKGDRPSAPDRRVASLYPWSSPGIHQLGGIREEPQPTPAELESRDEHGSDGRGLGIAAGDCLWRFRRTQDVDQKSRIDREAPPRLYLSTWLHGRRSAYLPEHDSAACRCGSGRCVS